MMFYTQIILPLIFWWKEPPCVIIHEADSLLLSHTSHLTGSKADGMKPRRSCTVCGILCIRCSVAADITRRGWQQKSARKLTLTNWNSCNKFIDQQIIIYQLQSANFCTVCVMDGVIFPPHTVFVCSESKN